MENHRREPSTRASGNIAQDGLEQVIRAEIRDATRTQIVPGRLPFAL